MEWKGFSEGLDGWFLLTSQSPQSCKGTTNTLFGLNELEEKERKKRDLGDTMTYCLDKSGGERFERKRFEEIWLKNESEVSLNIYVQKKGKFV